MTAYLEITLKVQEKNRPAAAEVYTTYREPFLKQVKGAKTKALLVRDDDVQVLHGFDNVDNAQAYLKSHLFKEDVATKLKPLLETDPEVRVYAVAE
ncbi:MAG: hypothetical protein P8175_02735 [Deltaproteobacteria bacterium]|jgi:hypothetical protein